MLAKLQTNALGCGTVLLRQRHRFLNTVRAFDDRFHSEPSNQINYDLQTGHKGLSIRSLYIATMNGTPRIALCLFGQMRTYETCYKYLKRNVLDELDPDVFIHTWKNRGGTWRKGQNGDVSDAVVTHAKLQELYAPKSWQSEISMNSITMK